MLTDLTVTGLGTIDRASVSFGRGLNVITGETGAGKTMLLRALSMALGGRTDPGWVAPGCSEATADVRFIVPSALVAELETDDLGPAELDIAEVEVTLGRTLGARSRATINGRLAPAANQAAVAERLLSFHGQHQQRLLSRPDTQRDLLDRYAGRDHYANVVAARDLFLRMRECEASLHALRVAMQDAHRAAQSAKEVCDDFDAVNPGDTELQDLNERIDLLANAAAIVAVVRTVNEHIDGTDDEPGARGRVYFAARDLTRMAGAQPTLAQLASQLESIGLDLDDFISRTRVLAESIESHPGELEAAQARRAAINSLLGRHARPDVAALRDLVEDQRSLADVSGVEDAVSAGEQHMTGLQQAWALLVADINRGRRESAARLEREVTATLAQLSLPHAAFSVRVQPGQPTRCGEDDIEFLLDTAGSQVMLGAGASGGEMSRVALAVEAAVADVNPVEVMVFDEIDAGIGGQTAHDVAQVLARLSRTSQVIVVTHLPQVAALADHHIHVWREPDGTRVGLLDQEQRVLELARMLGDKVGPQAARQFAAELLAASAPSAAPYRVD